MAEFPAFPIWTDAYLGDTSHLTTIEHGAYLLLLFAAWRSKDGMLPDDDKMLARYSRLTTGQWKRIRPVLQPFFSVDKVGDNFFWIQGRLTDELKAVRQHSRRQSNNSKARWLKNKETTDPAEIPPKSQIDAPLALTLPSEKPPLPPDKPEEGWALKDRKGEEGAAAPARYSIVQKLSDEAHEKAKLLCKSLNRDFYNLAAIYDEGVTSGKRSPPNSPDPAFLAWIPAYTKGEKL